MSKRIVMLVANGYAPDPRVHKEARILEGNGYKLSVVCWDRERKRRPSQVIDGISVRRFRYLVPTGFISFSLSGVMFLISCTIFLLRDWKRRGKVVIHCHDFNTLPVGYLLRYLCPRKFGLVYDSHESFSDLLRTIAPSTVVALVKTLERIMLSRIDAMITANDLILRNLNPSSKIPSVAIYNAPPLSILSISNQPINEVVSGLRHEFGADSFVLLYYGALRNYRGLDALLDAANLSRHLVDKKIVFLIVGDGPMESPLRYDVKRRGLRNVKFLPHMGFDMMMDLVKDVDAVYIGFEPEDPNNYFASPNKLFEAMAMRKPVVTSGFGLLGKIVQQIGCGVKLRSIEGRSIMAAIQKLFDQDFAKKCGENGQIAFRSFYNWDEMARRLESLYSTLQ